jgi:hypothetical protein
MIRSRLFVRLASLAPLTADGLWTIIYGANLLTDSTALPAGMIHGMETSLVAGLDSATQRDIMSHLKQ